MASTTHARRYACPHCSKSYAKSEHLIRHERSHSGSQPFICNQCQRRFSRHDSLVRHTKRHVNQIPHDPLTQVVSESSPVSQENKIGSNGVPHTLEINPLPGSDQIHSEVSHHPALLDHATIQTDMSIDDESFLSLNWPDSEELLNSIMSAELMPFPGMETVPSQSNVRNNQQLQLQEQPTSPWLSQEAHEPFDHGGTHAVRNLSSIINSLSADVTTEAQSIGLTSAFLDGCLHVFLTQFVPSFPVVHAPTFIFRDWTHPLLLNAIALGSLFMEDADYTAKGEVIWRLAHTAVATSWHTLIKHRGPYDPCSGVQLVLTALLGQVYAMLSKNRTLRMTAHIFHSLGFYWARETGMHEVDIGNQGLPDTTNDTNMDIDTRWRSWAARETQIRALLGHYILDGQLAGYSGGPTCQRHMSNLLPVASEDIAFRAEKASSWLAAVQSSNCTTMPFAKLYNAIFSHHLHVKHLGTGLAPFIAAVLLEGLKSIVADKVDSDIEIVGLPSRVDVARALGRLHTYILQSTVMSKVEKDVALLRWHAIGLDLAVSSNLLCRTLCRQYNISQSILGGTRSPKDTPLPKWTSSPAGRKALLHAVGIHDIVQELPMGKGKNIHVPASIFIGGIVYCAFQLAGTPTINVPEVTEWESLMLVDAAATCDWPPIESDLHIRSFLSGSTIFGQKQRNLKYDLYGFLSSLKTVERVWGVTTAMRQILEQLSAICARTGEHIGSGARSA